MSNLELSPQVFSILSHLIEEKVGLHYALLDRELLQEKISGRAMEIGFNSLLDYYYYLRYDPHGEQELSELIETLVVNETYFFREWPAIEALVDSYIAPACEASQRPRILSAACATGEEPLSLAMRLDDRHLLDKVELVACDISARALARATQRHFGKRSLRQVPSPKLVDRYICHRDEGYTVISRLFDAIRWEKCNLLSDEELSCLGTFDVILCRNVLIYFSDETVKAVLDRLSRALSPNGILLVGVSESLMRFGSRFIGEEKSGSFFYRKANLL
jgi:chemotaxis protein methyltransferase CheR